MADEAKDLGAISNDGITPNAVPTPQPQAEEPEVKILEEHVTRAAPLKNPPPAASIPTPPAPPPPRPIEVTSPTPAVKPVVPPPPAPPVVTPPTPTPTKAPSVPYSDPIADDVGLVLAPKTKPAPKAPIVPPPAPVPKMQSTNPPIQKPAPMAPIQNEAQKGGPALGADIANILATVKLPERREVEKQIGANEPKKFDTSIAGSVDTPPVASAGAAAIPPIVTPPVPNPSSTQNADKNPSSVAAVHTLKDDLQGAVHEQKISLVRAVSLEEDRRARTTAGPSESPAARQRSHRTFGIIFAALTLLGLGAAALFGVAFVMNQQNTSPQIDTGTSILFAEQSVLLSLNDQSPGDLKRTLESGRAASQGTLGSITRIIAATTESVPDGTVQNRAATFREFMTAIGAHPPDSLLRALADDFFLGIHVVDENVPVLVVPVTSHDHAFAAMLAWEDGMNADLTPLFSAVPTLTQNADGLPIKRTYEDLVMRNYDVRALKDDAGTIQLYYSFPTKNILIIAESPYSFPEILSRLQAGRQL